MENNRIFTQEEIYMARCIELARKGKCEASPNPMVGAVIVCDGKIIGEGYHRICGDAHEERRCLQPEITWRTYFIR